MSSKNWLKPATWVGSSVWSVISVLFKTLNAAARSVVLGNGSHVIPILGLIWFRDSVSLLCVLKKSPLTPRVNVTFRRRLMYE